MAGPHWLLYALGRGVGHLNRAIALARAASKPRLTCGSSNDRSRSRRLTIVTNTAYASRLPIERELGPDCRIVRIPPHGTRKHILARLWNVIDHDAPDVFLVDTFPRGLGGELVELLPRLKCPRLLIHRDLTPRYADRENVRESVEQYEHFLLPGEAGPLAGMRPGTWTAPWLVRDAEELFSVGESRRLLGAADRWRPLVLVVGCGRREESEQMRQLAADLAADLEAFASVRLSVLWQEGSNRAANRNGGAQEVNLWPLLAALPGVDLLVGAGGYNTVYEAEATGTPLLAMPRQRLYDRQALRLSPGAKCHSFGEIRNRVWEMLRQRTGRVAARPASGYINGVHHAVEVIDAFADAAVEPGTPPKSPPAASASARPTFPENRKAPPALRAHPPGI